MKSAQLFHVLFLVGLSTIVLFAQNKSSKTTGIKKQVKKEDVIENNAGKLKTTAASGDSVSFRDSDGNTLLKINDEGTAGSITIPPGSAPTTTTNKLYNIGSTLLFNGSTLGGGATSINDLSDAKYDGYSLFLGEGAGTNDDGTSNVNTAVGKIALYSNTSGYDNTANGFGALYLNTIGEGNTAIGLNALSTNTTGSANTAVGKNADVASNNLINATAIGYGATVNASNKVRLGNSAVSVIEGQVAYTYTSDSTKRKTL